MENYLIHFAMKQEHLAFFWCVCVYVCMCVCVRACVRGWVRGSGEGHGGGLFVSEKKYISLTFFFLNSHSKASGRPGEPYKCELCKSHIKYGNYTVPSLSEVNTDC